MAPRPMMPSVLPWSWVICPRGQAPARVCASRRGMQRATASISASACSAMEVAATPGVLVTVTP